MRTRVATVTAEPGAPAAAPSLSGIFLCFLKLGSVAFGGVYAMLSLFERELVARRRWITSDELAERVAVAQMTPGPPIVNTGVLVGYRLRGFAGALAATGGQILPGFVVVLVVGVAYAEFASSPVLRGILRGIAAAVVGLLASVVLAMARRLVDGARPAALAVACFALLAFSHANPILIVACAGAAGPLLLGGRR